MVELLVFFVAACLLLYVVLGGADYGAGILELFPIGELRDRQKQLINRAMGPVWEANHIWLIIVVVILFMGFPKAFEIMMTSLHLPMVALLTGIVARGAAFTFRRYDAAQEARSQRAYTVLFGLSSLWTALWLGVIAASLFRGRIAPGSNDAWDAYVAPWWGVFPLATGAFVAAVFAYLASIYLVGESDDDGLRRRYRRQAFALNVAVVASGGAVFLCSAYDENGLALAFASSWLSLAAMAGATALFAALWTLARRKHFYWARVLAAGQSALILFGWYSAHAPNALLTRAGPLSFYEAAAPPATLWQLCFALLVGSAFIFPSLYLLLRVFKSSPAQ